MNTLDKIKTLRKAQQVLIETEGKLGICSAILTLLKGKEFITHESVLENFPELLKYKPDVSVVGNLWWKLTMEGQQIRIAVLTLVLNDLHKQLEKEIEGHQDFYPETN